VKRSVVVLALLAVAALATAGVLAQGRNEASRFIPPSPGTPGEASGIGDRPRAGKGGGFPASNAREEDPHPNPPPEYRGRGKSVRFGHVDVFLDSAGQSLAAYQCEIIATAGDVTLVGIEGGEHAAFKVPPYYDPKALGQKRIILGAFNTGTDLPSGRTRVARLMVQITGDARPAFDAKVQVAASPDGKATPATISVSDPDSEGAER
jgi:hypothetical protein